MSQNDQGSGPSLTEASTHNHDKVALYALIDRIGVSGQVPVLATGPVSLEFLYLETYKFVIANLCLDSIVEPFA